MLKNNRNLIALFATLFLILLGIQGYLMYKTYQVKERDINRSVIDRMKDYTDQLEDKNRMKKVMNDDAVQNVFAFYKDKKLSKKQFLNYFQKFNKLSQSDFSQYIDRQFENEGYIIAVKIQYLSIVTLPEKINLIDQPITIFETKNKVSKPGIVSTGNWETSSTTTDDDHKNLKQENNFHVKSTTSFEILNIKEVVFKELILLILLCVFILGSVLWLFILTVKNLIKQQKQVEVLHTVVDNISHEFKTPIATLKIAAKALNKDWNKENLPLIERQICRLENVMKQIHNDEDATVLNQNITFQDWNYFLEDLKFLHPDIEFNYKNNVAKTLPFSKINMETLVKNLSDNSIKYGASKVLIFINLVEGFLELKVQDNGKGIAKKEQKNIFEKFFRIQHDNIHNTKGLGLGLYLVKNLVKKHNGTIDLISEVNEGSNFTIKLPYEN
ncbi:MAG: ATP-binding protein [Flavobacterium sp.]